MAMTEFFKSFGAYWKEAPFASFAFWAFPICTLLFIWLLTTVGLKIFRKRKKLKKVFLINRAWLISSIVAAFILISLICSWWSQNFFSRHPYQLSLLISLTVAMVIPAICLLKLRTYYTQENIKEITHQPKTPGQLSATIVYTKKAFGINKLYFILPLFGFLFLLLYLYKGTNLITVVFDNSLSMPTEGRDALAETFGKLQENNEVILTTLNGPNYNEGRSPYRTLTDLMRVRRTSELNAGNIVLFTKPIDAQNAVNSITAFHCCSPICESLWKTYLYLKENKTNESYSKKLLIIMTDGYDDIDTALTSGNFFYDDKDFADFFPPENTFIIEYTPSQEVKPFMERFTSAGAEKYEAENNKSAYLDALDSALKSYKNNWFLIIWTAIIFLLFTLIGVLISPKKIA